MNGVPRKQAGASLVTLTILFGVFGLVTILVIKLVPIYLEYYEVVQSLEQIKSTSLVNVDQSERKIKNTVLEHLEFKDVRNVLEDDIRITKLKDSVIVSVQYEVRVFFVANIDLAVGFSDDVEVR